MWERQSKPDSQQEESESDDEQFTAVPAKRRKIQIASGCSEKKYEMWTSIVVNVLSKSFTNCSVSPSDEDGGKADQGNKTLVKAGLAPTEIAKESECGGNVGDGNGNHDDVENCSKMDEILPPFKSHKSEKNRDKNN